MDIKKIYSRLVQANSLIAGAIDFYKAHKDEIDSTLKRFGNYFKTIKNDWDLLWDYDLEEKPIPIDNIDADLEDVKNWVRNKTIVTTADLVEPFNINPIEARILCIRLRQEGVLEQDKDDYMLYHVVNKDLLDR